MVFCRLLCSLLLMCSAYSLFAQCGVDVSAGDDVFLCQPPTPAQLQGDINGPYLNFFWTPTAGLSPANSLTPNVTVTQTTKYVLTARVADFSNNLIDNGDFEGGNTGFSSDYVFSPGDLVPEGLYDIVPNPQASHPGFAPCGDHTSGSGNMMAVNGAGVPNQNVWCQTVNVSPNTTYVFSAWVTTLVSASPALLQFSINGGTIGPIFSAPGTNCQWINFFTTWNSGANSSATICIVNQNTVLGGNDFALDDLLFSPVCLVTDTVTVHVVPVVAVATPPVTVIPCSGSSVTLSGVGSSVGPNVTYLWETQNGNIVSGETTLNPVVDAGGTYTLTVFIENEGTVCEKSASVSVLENPNPLNAWINPPQPLGCGSATTLLIGNSSQPAFSTYQWSTADGNIVSGANSKNATVDEVGSYTLLVTNTQTGCTATAEVNVTSAANPPLAVANADTISCVVQNTLLDGTGSSVGPNINYVWTTGNGLILSGQNSQNAQAGAPGVYVLAVTNSSNNCTTRDTVAVVGDLIAPNLGINLPDTLTCTADTLALSAFLTPANAPFLWSSSNGGNIVSGANTLMPVVNAAGQYRFSATNLQNGCSSADTVWVQVDTLHPLAVVLPADTLTCQEPQQVLSGAGSSSGPAFDYVWSTPNGNIVSGDNTLNPIVNAPGLYNLHVLNVLNGCTAANGVQVPADTNAITAAANAPDTLTCVVDSVLLNTNGSSNGPGFLYNWNTPNGLILSGGQTPQPAVGLPGIYALQISNPANGCTATDTVTVQLNNLPPQLSIGTTDLLTCILPAVQITAQNATAGPHLFQWSTVNGAILSGADSLAPIVNEVGWYLLQAVNLVNGCTDTDSVEVQRAIGTPAAQASVNGVLNCVAPTLTLSANGSTIFPGYTLDWSVFGNGNIVNGAQTGNPVVDEPGVYVLLVTNTANGCTDTDTVAVQQNILLPPATVEPPIVLTCTTPAQTLTANLGVPDSLYQYNWLFQNQAISDSNTVDISLPGLYAVVVSNPLNGCFLTDSVLVSADQVDPQLTPGVPAGLTCVVSSVVLPLTFSPAGIAFDWQTTDGHFVSSAQIANPVVDQPGTYSLQTVNPLNGCTATAQVVVGQNTAVPNADAGPPFTLTCTNPQFVIQGSADAGTTAAWNTLLGNIVSGASSLQPLVDAPGTYTLTVTNPVNGCTNTDAVTIAENTTPPPVQAGADDTLSCTVVSLSLQGNTANASVSWTALNGGNILNGNTTLTPVIDAPGSYALLATDLVNGCTASDTVKVFADADAPTVQLGQAPVLTCLLSQAGLTASASAGPQFNYQWSTVDGLLLSGLQTLSPTVGASGTYQLMVSNINNGCTESATLFVPIDTLPPNAEAGPAKNLTCALTQLSLEGNSSTQNTVFAWTSATGGIVSGANTKTPLVNQAGVYTLMVTQNANGCTAEDVVSVGLDTLHPVLSVVPPAVLTCDLTDLTLQANVVAPGAFTPLWSTLDGNIVAGAGSLNPVVDAPGMYLLQVQNTGNGCSNTILTTVLENVNLPVVDAGAADTLTCLVKQLSLNGSATPAGIGFAYAWTTANGGQIQSGAQTAAPIVNAAGTFTLTVTRADNGCTASDATTVVSFTIPPTIAIALPGVLTCTVDTIPVSASVGTPPGQSTVNASWSTPNGHIAGYNGALNPLVDKPGNYQLAVTRNDNGCTAQATVAVLQDVQSPVLNTGPDELIYCSQPTVSLLVESVTPGLSYLWASSNGNVVSGNTSATPLVDAEGLYTVTATSPINGCTAIGSIGVEEVPLPAFVPDSEQPTCLKPKGSILFGPVSGGMGPFVYSINGGLQFSNNNVYSGLAAGTYTVVVKDDLGCTATDEVALIAPPTAILDIQDVFLLPLGDSVLLQPVTNLTPPNALNWLWTPAAGLSCFTCPEPIAKPGVTTQYTVTVSDPDGCSANARVLIRVDRRRQLYAPNVITPDANTNNRFTLYGKGVEMIENLQVFDRWGNMAFHATDLGIGDESVGWDGTFQADPVNPGVFIWQAKVRFIDGETEVFAGDVTVVR
ncbi:MAG: hypothetical protein ACOYNO_00510 [Saprospiraceae bacterium]